MINPYDVGLSPFRIADGTLFDANPSRMFTQHGDEAYPSVKCPSCGGDYCHPCEVSVKQGESQTIVFGDSTITSRATKDDSRGSDIRIVFWCESGHEFVCHFWFHKGNTFISSFCGDSTAEEGGPDNMLWRD